MTSSDSRFLPKPAAAPAKPRGRPIKNGAAASDKITLRLTPAHKAKLKTLGGASWIVRQLDKTLD